MSDAYREYAVSPALAPFVACYWSRDAGGAGYDRYPVVPDGCIDLLYFASAGLLSVVGAMRETLWVDDRGPSQFVGVRFKAGGAVPFLRERADRLTDRLIAADQIFGRDGDVLRRRLAERLCVADQVWTFERFLLERLGMAEQRLDRRVAWASTQLAMRPRLRVESLAEELGLSRQYLRRLFVEHTGLSPKTFGRVGRLRRLLAVLRDGTPAVDAALEAGYADQAHMVHEFRALVGRTPAAYRAWL